LIGQLQLTTVRAKHLEDKLSVVARHASPNASPLPTDKKC
jgi:hypothetical protein